MYLLSLPLTSGAHKNSPPIHSNFLSGLNFSFCHSPSLIHPLYCARIILPNLITDYIISPLKILLSLPVTSQIRFRVLRCPPEPMYLTPSHLPRLTSCLCHVICLYQKELFSFHTRMSLYMLFYGLQLEFTMKTL